MEEQEEEYQNALNELRIKTANLQHLVKVFNDGIKAPEPDWKLIHRVVYSIEEAYSDFDDAAWMYDGRWYERGQNV